MKNFKKIMATLIAFAMLIGVLPIGMAITTIEAVAAESTPQEVIVLSADTSVNQVHLTFDANDGILDDATLGIYKNDVKIADIPAGIGGFTLNEPGWARDEEGTDALTYNYQIKSADGSRVSNVVAATPETAQFALANAIVLYPTLNDAGMAVEDKATIVANNSTAISTYYKGNRSMNIAPAFFQGYYKDGSTTLDLLDYGTPYVRGYQTTNSNFGSAYLVKDAMPWAIDPWNGTANWKSLYPENTFNGVAVTNAMWTPLMSEAAFTTTPAELPGYYSGFGNAKSNVAAWWIPGMQMVEGVKDNKRAAFAPFKVTPSATTEAKFQIPNDYNVYVEYFDDMRLANQTGKSMSIALRGATTTAKLADETTGFMSATQGASEADVALMTAAKVADHALTANFNDSRAWETATATINNFVPTSYYYTNIGKAMGTGAWLDSLGISTGGTGISLLFRGIAIVPAADMTGLDLRDPNAIWYSPGYGAEVPVGAATTRAMESIAPPVPTTYTVTFDANGGTGTMDSVIVTKGETLTLPECGFTAPEGKEFISWEKDGERYKVGNQITITANTTLKALWKSENEKIVLSADESVNQVHFEIELTDDIIDETLYLYRDDVRYVEIPAGVTSYTLNEPGYIDEETGELKTYTYQVKSADRIRYSNEIIAAPESAVEAMAKGIVLYPHINEAGMALGDDLADTLIADNQAAIINYYAGKRSGQIVPAFKQGYYYTGDTKLNMGGYGENYIRGYVGTSEHFSGYLVKSVVPWAFDPWNGSLSWAAFYGDATTFNEVALANAFWTPLMSTEPITEETYTMDIYPGYFSGWGAEGTSAAWFLPGVHALAGVQGNKRPAWAPFKLTPAFDDPTFQVPADYDVFVEYYDHARLSANTGKTSAVAIDVAVAYGKLSDNATGFNANTASEADAAIMNEAAPTLVTLNSEFNDSRAWETAYGTVENMVPTSYYYAKPGKGRTGTWNESFAVSNTGNGTSLLFRGIAIIPTEEVAKLDLRDKNALWYTPGYGAEVPIDGKTGPEPVTYTISYSANGGTGTMDSVIVTEGETLTLPECGFTAPENKEFDGWEVNSEKYEAGATITITADTTIKATWKDILYTVSYDANGGTGSIDPESIVSGSEYTLPENAFTAPENKEFDGWEVNGEKYEAGAIIIITADTTIKATWKDILYTVSYDANGGTGSIDPESIVSGSEYTLPENAFTAPENKEFDGWEVNGEKYDAGATIIITADTTIYALWKEAPVTPPSVTYTVTFNADGGSGSMDDVIVSEGGTYTLPECGFTAPFNKEFIGWEVNRTTYSAGDTITINADTTIYALWQRVHLENDKELVIVTNMPKTGVEKGDTYTVSYYFDNFSDDVNIIALNFELPYDESVISIENTGTALSDFVIDNEAAQLKYLYTDLDGEGVSTNDAVLVAQMTITISDGYVSDEDICLVPEFVYYKKAGEPDFFENVEIDFKREFILSFDANGGTGNMESTTVTGDERFILPECEFTAPLYQEFIGWEIDGVTYAPGDEVVFADDAIAIALWDDIDYLYGDADNNGVIGEIFDVFAVIDHYLELEKITDNRAFIQADIAPSYGKIDFMDISVFIDYYLELIKSMPVPRR